MRRANALLARAHAAHLPGAALLDNFALSLEKGGSALPGGGHYSYQVLDGRLMALCQRLCACAALRQAEQWRE